MPPTRRIVPLERFALVADGRDRVLQVLKDAMAQLEQRFAGRRDADAAADAMEDRLAELVLEQQDLPADRRLRDVQLLAGGGERSGVGDGADDLELPQVHASAYICSAHGFNGTDTLGRWCADLARARATGGGSAARVRSIA